MAKPKKKSKDEGPVHVSIGKSALGIDTDGDITTIALTKFDQRITMTEEQALSLGKYLVKRFGGE